MEIPKISLKLHFPYQIVIVLTFEKFDQGGVCTMAVCGGRWNFSKVRSLVILYSAFSSERIFENLQSFDTRIEIFKSHTLKFSIVFMVNGMSLKLLQFIHSVTPTK